MSMQLSSKASVGALLNDSSSSSQVAAPTSNANHPSLHFLAGPMHSMPPTRMRPHSPPPLNAHHHLHQPLTTLASPPPQQSSNSPITPTNGTTPKKKHVCPTCDKGFTTSGHLARHARVHTGERNHKCPFPGCETRCSRQDNLQQHYRIHLSPGSRRSSSSATRAAMNRAMEVAQHAASTQGHSNSESPVQSPSSSSTGSAQHLQPFQASHNTPTASEVVNPLNSSMVGGGGGDTSNRSSPASSHSGGAEFRRSNSVQIPSSGNLNHAGNSLGLHSVPSPAPGSGYNQMQYQTPPERLSLSLFPPPPPPNQQNQSYFTLRPPYTTSQSYHSSTPNSTTSTHSTPLINSQSLSNGQNSNSPVSPAASISTVSSPVAQYSPVHSGSSHHHHNNHQHGSFGAPDDRRPRLPPIQAHQPHPSMTYPPPIPRSSSYYATPFNTGGAANNSHYSPVSAVSLGMAGAGMGPSWKDGLGLHVGSGSPVSMTPVGSNAYHHDGHDYRRR